MPGVGGDPSEEFQFILNELSVAIGIGGSDFGILVRNITRTVADLIGDGCMITLLDEEGEHLVNVACAHRNRQLQTAYNAFMMGMKPLKRTSNTISAEVVRTGQPKLAAEVKPEEMVAKTDEELRPLVAKLNVHSFVVLPISDSTSVIGTISLLRSTPHRSYKAEDLVLLSAVAEQIGFAIHSARPRLKS